MGKVYQAINRVQAALAKEGIAKDRTNPQQGYKFRGIDDVYNAVCGLLAENGLCILPRVVAQHREERQTAKGGTLLYTILTVEFDFVAAEDGSKHTAVMVGEAMDSGDKSANKAMSAAYKYALLQVFAIPTEADNDTENHTHEPAPRATTTKTLPPKPDKIANPTYEKVRDALRQCGCETAEDAADVVRLVTPSQTIAMMRERPDLCQMFLDCYQMALIEYKTTAALFAAAKATAAL